MTKQEIHRYAKKAERIEKDSFLLELCKGKTVLDVGCIGQDRDFSSPEWLHNKLRKVARQIDGVDILTDQISHLNAQGYSMYSVEELQTKANTYDVVVMSDVIEHVNDPVGFLSFYSRFLNENGKIFVSTPNSNRSINFVNILFNNNYTVNPEHVFWFCPKTLLEVTLRANLSLKDFYWAGNYFELNEVKGIYQKFKIFISNLLFKVRPNFSPNMIFILTRK